MPANDAVSGGGPVGVSGCGTVLATASGPKSATASPSASCNIVRPAGWA